MNKIVIFGATGRTGIHAVYHAVRNGYDTRVFVRDEEKIPSDIKDKVEIVVGDITDSEQVDKATKDRDGVVVVLGTRDDLSPTTVLSTGMKNIIEAMKANKIKLVSACLSAFLYYEPEKVPPRFKDINSEHQRMLDLIKETDLDWVAVLPPHIADNPDPNYIVEHGKSPGHQIPKQQLGEFLVECLQNPANYRKTCGIAVKKK